MESYCAFICYGWPFGSFAVALHVLKLQICTQNNIMTSCVYISCTQPWESIENAWHIAHALIFCRTIRSCFMCAQLSCHMQHPYQPESSSFICLFSVIWDGTRRGKAYVAATIINMYMALCAAINWECIIVYRVFILTLKMIGVSSENVRRLSSILELYGREYLAFHYFFLLQFIKW